MRTLFSIITLSLLVVIAGCTKGAFDINNTNPNSPTTVSPSFSLPSALTATAGVMYGGSEDILNTWMGYWAVSGDYTASPTYLVYQLNSSTATGNWDAAYLNLVNYNLIVTESATDSTLVNYSAIGIIMKAFLYQRIVDLYNNAPYTNALVSGNFTPAYSNGADIYADNIKKIDSAIALINSAGANAVIPTKVDVMFNGDMSMWLKFANTLKLKMLMRLTQTASGSATIQSELSGLTTSSFLGAGEDGAVNPGYSTAADNQENPLYLDLGFTSSGSPGTNNQYFRANSYAVNFYYNHNDPRVSQIYETKSSGKAVGRVLGSTLLEHNSAISAVTGPGLLKGADQDAVILPAFESFFLQAEAAQRGFLAGNAASLYKSGVAESFRLLGADTSSVTAYTSQSDPLTNYSAATDKINLIITQKWAACNSLDPLESYSDWRRLGLPASLPVSVYPGNPATHIPYRLPYPISEDSYNSANVAAQGSVDFLTSKIFWMP